MSSSERSVIVTGAARGIGRAIAEALLADGHAVTLLDSNAATLAECQAALATAGRAHFAVVDVTDEAGCQRVVAEAVARFGGVQVLVNNAGIGVSSLRDDAELRHPSIEELSADVYRRFFEVNVLGTVNMTRACIGEMKRAGWGRIINNTTSYLTMHRVQPYGASKSALESVSAVWAKELEGSGITVNVVVPGGPTDTPFVKEIGIAREKMLRAAVMAPPVQWLVSDEADGMSGRRFVAGHWDTRLAPAAAAVRCARSIGWPELTGDVVWPS